ncbi:C2 calcium-dependent membrane-targeting protein [Tanacetum coccineum]
MSDYESDDSDVQDFKDLDMIFELGRLEQQEQEEAERVHHRNYIYRERIWHAFFGVAGANNDLTVLNNSPLFDDLLDGIDPVAPFECNGVTFEKGYYLADGIYPQWASFVKSFTVASSEKNVLYKRKQEGARKDIERAFGVLQGRTSDPYVVLQLDSQIVKSKIKWGTKEDEELALYIKLPPNNNLQLEVCSSDTQRTERRRLPFIGKFLRNNDFESTLKQLVGSEPVQARQFVEYAFGKFKSINDAYIQKDGSSNGDDCDSEDSKISTNSESRSDMVQIDTFPEDSLESECNQKDVSSQSDKDFWKNFRNTTNQNIVKQLGLNQQVKKLETSMSVSHFKRTALMLVVS